MKSNLVIFAVMVAFLVMPVYADAVEKEVELPLGTKRIDSSPDQLVFLLPDGKRLELTGGNSAAGFFQQCVVKGPQGGTLLQGGRAHFVQPSIEKLVVLDPSVRLVAIDDDVTWVRQGAPVPEGSYLRIGDEVVWLPAKLHFTMLPGKIELPPPPGRPKVQPR
ncbi:MAG: hypothetical protein RB296_04335 [Acidobacteriota bacterium]|jgi:hypothetical protein|nr:hypothetical protein [Acidobacteriota bacterium]